MSWLERMAYIALLAIVAFALWVQNRAPERDCRPAVVLMQDGEWT